MRAFLLAICLLIIGVSYGQKSPAVHRQSPGLNGIGAFKINVTTTADIELLASKTGQPVMRTQSLQRLNYAADSAIVLEVLPNKDILDASDQAIACPGYRVLFLPTYKVAGFTLRQVYLRFYAGRLIDIVPEWNEDLNEALALKHGKPYARAKVAAVGCVFVNNGNRITHKAIEATEEWFNGSIRAVSYSSRRYDGQCREILSKSFHIGNDAKLKALNGCEAKQEQADRLRSIKEKKQRMSEI